MSIDMVPKMSITETPETGLRSREKWGATAITAGFTVIPNHLLAINQFLPEDDRLSPTEMVVLLQLIATWWTPDRLPFPSKATLAKRTGLSARQVQRAVQGLERKGFLKRISRFAGTRGRTSNAYDLQGTVKAVREVAGQNPTAFKRDVSIPEGE